MPRGAGMPHRTNKSIVDSRLCPQCAVHKRATNQTSGMYRITSVFTYLLGGVTAMPRGLLARLCHALLVDTTTITTTVLCPPGLCPGLPGWAGTRKVKTNLDFLEQEIVSGSAICWAICKSVPHPRQTTTPISHHSVFYRPDALPAAQQQCQSTEGNKALKTNRKH